jgi:hypothetical protein
MGFWYGKNDFFQHFDSRVANIISFVIKVIGKFLISYYRYNYDRINPIYSIKCQISKLKLPNYKSPCRHPHINRRVSLWLNRPWHIAFISESTLPFENPRAPAVRALEELPSCKESFNGIGRCEKATLTAGLQFGKFLKNSNYIGILDKVTVFQFSLFF